LGVESPGVGIVIKISDGDPESRSRVEPNSRVRPGVALELLRQMGYIQKKELEALAAEFGPVKPVLNWRKLVVGEARPIFTLQKPTEDA